jgi:23S rRNA pseudouridine1911/1915/1917 synthase
VDSIIATTDAPPDVLRTHRHRHSSRAVWSARLDRGEVEVGGVRAHRATVVRPQDRLVWHRPPWDEPPVDTRYAVVLEDHALLAIAKPCGLPTSVGHSRAGTHSR